jgi:hypothetical protein
MGSLYTNALEGIVDWIHRKLIFYSFDSIQSRAYRRVLMSLQPLSVSSRGRLVAEAARFYDEYSLAPHGQPKADLEAAQKEFVRKVLADVLWLEGKLVGTPLEGPYQEYRAEGELQLGTALLLPLVSAAVGYAFHLQSWHLALLIIIVTLLATKLADYGLYYFRRAHSFIAHHISDGTVLTPSMETMKRAALKRQAAEAAILSRQAEKTWQWSLLKKLAEVKSDFGKSMLNKKGQENGRA